MSSSSDEPERTRPWLWLNASGGASSIGINLTDEEALMRVERGDRIAPLGGWPRFNDRLWAEVNGTPSEE